MPTFVIVDAVATLSFHSDDTINTLPPIPTVASPTIAKQSAGSIVVAFVVAPIYKHITHHALQLIVTPVNKCITHHTLYRE